MSTLLLNFFNDLSSVNVAASFNNKGYQRVDYFNYLDSDPEQTSDKVNHQGFVTKGGANYNINENHNVFANLGYFQTAPTFDNIFINYVNDINEGAKNEKTMAFELGYGYKSSTLAANINAYYTNWRDKQFQRSVRQPDGEYYSANIEGVNALHTGIEADFVWSPAENVEITGMASLGNWIWQNDLENVPIFNDEQVKIDEVSLYIADLKVGDAAQTAFAVGLNYELFEGFKFGVDYTYYGNLYAEFDPTGRSSAETKGIQAWKLPEYGLLDANVRYNFNIGDFDAVIYCNITNLLDTEYVAEADDGGDWENSRVFYGIGRNWSTGLRVYF